MNLPRLLISAAVGVTVAGTVSGTPFRYEVSSVATGTLGSTSFTDAEVTITTIANTTDVKELVIGPIASLWQVAGPTTISVSGVGTATFLVNDFGVLSGNIFGFGLGVVADLTEITPILGVAGSPDLVGFDLKSPLGPVKGPAFFINETFLTSMGNLNITATGELATFQAAAVPEPEQAMAVAGVLLVGAALYRRTRR